MDIRTASARLRDLIGDAPVSSRVSPGSENWQAPAARQFLRPNCPYLLRQMTQPFDLEAQREFVDNDDGLADSCESASKIRQAARSAKQDVLLELRKIGMLLSAFDLCVEKAWERQGIAEDSELDQTARTPYA